MKDTEKPAITISERKKRAEHRRASRVYGFNSGDPEKLFIDLNENNIRFFEYTQIKRLNECDINERFIILREIALLSCIRNSRSLPKKLMVHDACLNIFRQTGFYNEKHILKILSKKQETTTNDRLVKKDYFYEEINILTRKISFLKNLSQDTKFTDSKNLYFCSQKLLLLADNELDYFVAISMLDAYLYALFSINNPNIIYVGFVISCEFDQYLKEVKTDYDDIVELMRTKLELLIDFFTQSFWGEPDSFIFQSFKDKYDLPSDFYLKFKNIDKILLGALPESAKMYMLKQRLVSYCKDLELHLQKLFRYYLTYITYANYLCENSDLSLEEIDDQITIAATLEPEIDLNRVYYLEKLKNIISGGFCGDLFEQLQYVTELNFRLNNTNISFATLMSSEDIYKDSFDLLHERFYGSGHCHHNLTSYSSKIEYFRDAGSMLSYVNLFIELPEIAETSSLYELIKKIICLQYIVFKTAGPVIFDHYINSFNQSCESN